MAEEGDVEGGGHVEDVVRDDDLGSCVDNGGRLRPEAGRNYMPALMVPRLC